MKQLFTNQDQKETDRKLARILSHALEQKFISDLGLEGQPTESEIVSSIESWVTSIFATASKDGIFWDDARSTAPYAVLFVLFLCGRHKLGLRYLKEYYSESHLSDSHRAVIAALRDLYKAYFDKGCRGLARNQVKSFYENVLSADAPRDEYKTLLVHIMVGSRSREDPEFFSSVLFADTDIQTWYFLKLAGFEFLQE